MAVPTPIYHGDAGTKTKEDVLDTIAMMTPNDVPLLNLLDRRMVHHTTFECLMDDLPIPSTATTDAKRTDFTWAGTTTAGVTNGMSLRQPFQNYIMVNNQAVSVVDDHRHDDEYGFQDEFTWQQRKEGRRLLMKVENNLRWSNDTAGNSSTPYETAGILQILSQTGMARRHGASSTTIAGVAIDDAYFAYWYDQTDAALIQDELHDVLEGGAKNGLDINNSMLFCGFKIKRIISSFASVYTAGSGAGLSRWNQPASSHTLSIVVDFFETDVGELAICLDRYMVDEGKTSGSITAANPSTTGDDYVLDADQTFFVIDPDFWRVAIKSPLEFVPTAKIGATSDGYWVIHYGVDCRNTKAGCGASGVGG